MASARVKIKTRISLTISRLGLSLCLCFLIMDEIDMTRLKQTKRTTNNGIANANFHNEMANTQRNKIGSKRLFEKFFIDA